MGDALGLSLVHVNRTPQQLRAEGLITLKNGTLIILDSGLQKAGQYNRGYLHLKPRDLAHATNGHADRPANRRPIVSLGHSFR